MLERSKRLPGHAEKLYARLKTNAHECILENITFFAANSETTLKFLKGFFLLLLSWVANQAGDKIHNIPITVARREERIQIQNKFKSHFFCLKVSFSAGKNLHLTTDVFLGVLDY